VFSGFLFLWIRFSDVVFDIAGDFASEHTSVGKFRFVGFLLSNPAGAAILSAALLSAHPVLLRSLLRGSGRGSVGLSFVPF
jgi:hypothetical protein